MSNYPYNAIGQAGGAGDERALFLKEFAGLVLGVLPETQNSLGMTFKKVLKGAKSYQFPYLGKMKAGYHIPGVQLTGQATGQAEKVIALDSLLVVDRFVAKVDELMKHFDERSEYASQMGQTLATLKDNHIFMEACLGARASEQVTGTGANGLIITNDKLKLDTLVPANAQTGVELAQALKAAIKESASNFKKKDVPAGMKKVCYIDWDTYFTALDAVDTNGFSFFNKDYHTGSAESGMMPVLYGIHIQGTNNIISTDLSAVASDQVADTGVHFYHKGNYAKTVGVIMCEKAVAEVMAQDITVELGDYDVSRKGQLLTADLFTGCGWLRPECLVELVLDTVTVA
jgi:hypothetical protein